MKKNMVIATSVIHRRWEGAIYAYEPYVREADLWLSNFRDVRIVATIIDKAPDKNQITYIRNDIDFKNIPRLGGHTLFAKLKTLLYLPYVLLEIYRHVKSFEHLHIRLPGNIGFFALLLCPLLSNEKTAKYASQWSPFKQETSSAKLQKFLLERHCWYRNGKVLIYGNFENLKSHLLPFFTASYTENEISAANEKIKNKKFPLNGAPVILSIVGRMSANKGGVLCIKVLKILLEKKQNVVLNVVGDGEEIPEMKKLVNEYAINSRVIFHGNLEKAEVSSILEKTTFLLQPSITEG